MIYTSCTYLFTHWNAYVHAYARNSEQIMQIVTMKEQLSHSRTASDRNYKILFAAEVGGTHGVRGERSSAGQVWKQGFSRCCVSTSWLKQRLYIQRTWFYRQVKPWDGSAWWMRNTAVSIDSSPIILLVDLRFEYVSLQYGKPDTFCNLLVL